MKCPFALEPHQIQGLDFINIFPVIQWLVKESVNLRNEKAVRMKTFAVGQFHNNFKLSSSEDNRAARIEVLKIVRKIEDMYAATRQFRRKQNYEPEDEISRVRLTLLEYGVRNVSRSLAKADESKGDTSKTDNADELKQEEVC